MVPADADDITAQYNILLRELELYNPELMFKDRILAVTKSDMLDDELEAALKPTLPQGVPSIFISSVSGKGIMALKDLIWATLNRMEER